MATPFIALGLKGADAVIDKHFHKIPDKYVHISTYHPKNLPLPIISKRRRKRSQPGQDDQSTEEVDVEEEDKYVDEDIPRHSGYASPENITSIDRIPEQYSREPPKLRERYIPPPPVGSSSPPPFANYQFPPSPVNRFTPVPPQTVAATSETVRTQQPISQVPSSRGSREKIRSRDLLDIGKRERIDDYELSAADDRVRRPTTVIRRSSSHQPERSRGDGEYRGNTTTEIYSRRRRSRGDKRRAIPLEDRDDSPSDFYWERRGKAAAEGPGSRQLTLFKDDTASTISGRSRRPRTEPENAPRYQETATIQDDNRPSASQRSHKPKTPSEENRSSVSQRSGGARTLADDTPRFQEIAALQEDTKSSLSQRGRRTLSKPPRDQDFTRYKVTEREVRRYESPSGNVGLAVSRPRPGLQTRRSSSYQGLDRDRNSYTSYGADYYPPSASRNSINQRRRETSVPPPRYAPQIPQYDGRENEDNDSPGLFTKSTAGLTGGALGAVVGGWATQKAQRGSSRNSRAEDSNHVLTLLGAAVGGLAVNAVVERLEEGKGNRERQERGRRDSRVYQWDDGFSR